VKYLVPFFVLLASAVNAAPAVNLKNLSPTGDRAIVTYDHHWVEIDLSLDGGARPIAPPRGCEWTSMRYAPAADTLAMAAFCAGPVWDCAAGSSRLLVRHRNAEAAEVVSSKGGRWSGAYWQADERRIILIETLIKRPDLSGLDDLNRNVGRCGWHDAEFRAIDVGRGLSIGFDILPKGWHPKTVISADHQQLTAVIAAQDGVDDASPAGLAIRSVCVNPATAPAGLRAVCSARGYDVLMSWIDGEWRLGFDGTDELPRHGRVIATPARETVGKEICITSFSESLLGLACKLVISRGDETMQLKAIGGQFGDLALSGDGGVLAAMTAGRSNRNRRFDVWDLETGQHLDLAPLLDAVVHFGEWPPVR